MGAGSRSEVGGHAFLSYTREDSAQVDRLQQTLQAAGIPIWRDTSDLWPGENWRERIHEAITDDALVFIACFSANSLSRAKSYQNEELVLAIEQLRMRRPEQPWLIPVRLDDCRIPDLDIGAGRRLTSIQWVDLFGDRFEQEALRLVETIRRILRPGPDDRMPLADEAIHGRSPASDARVRYATPSYQATASSSSRWVGAANATADQAPPPNTAPHKRRLQAEQPAGAGLQAGAVRSAPLPGQRSSVLPCRPPVLGRPLVIKGYLATVTLHPDRVQIDRGVVGRANGNRSAVIPWSQLAGIDFLDPTRMINGHVHFVVGSDPRGLTATGHGNRLAAAARNPHAIMFTWQQRGHYEQLRAILTSTAISS